MNKCFLLVAVLFFALVSSCNDSSNKSTDANRPQNDSNSNTQITALQPGEDTAFIPVDTANKMIRSYLNSIQASSNDTNLRSIIIDGNALREYLTSAPGNNISHIKVMLAHQLDYINAGGNGIPCGYSRNGLTVILAGFDNSGNYLYFPVERVMNHGWPCPHLCATGTAASDTLVR